MYHIVKWLVFLFQVFGELHVALRETVRVRKKEKERKEKRENERER